jgi:hypothetical protein
VPHRLVSSSLLVGLLVATGGCERTVRDDTGGGRVTARTTSGNDSVAGPGPGVTALAASSGGDGGDGSSVSSASTGDGGFDGSGGKGGGDGGGVVEGPHVIEIALRSVDPRGDLSGSLVLVNTVEGGLRHVLHGEDLPAEIEVVDGDLVTFTDLADPGSSLSFDSYRVTPDVRRIERTAYIYPRPDGDPMQVTIDVPEVEGATHYVLDRESAPRVSDLPAGPYTFEQAGGYTDPQYGMVRAEGPSGTLAHAVFELPFQPGQAVTVTPEMRADRVTFDIDVTSLDGAESVEAHAFWWLGALTDDVSQDETLDDPPSTWSFAGSVIAPDVEGGRKLQVRARFPDIDGLCARAAFSHEGPGDERFTFDAAALRQPLFDGDLFTLDGPGDFGQYLARSQEYEGIDGEGYWTVHEDPARPPLPLVFPELPADVPAHLVPELESIRATSIAHADAGLDSYAAYVARPAVSFPRTTKVRALGGCSF